MKVEIEVKDQDEAEAVMRAMADPETRAFVVVAGILLKLPTRRARERVLRYVMDVVDEATSGDVTSITVRGSVVAPANGFFERPSH